MLSGIGSPFQPGTQIGPNLEVELISAHTRLAGSVNLGAYSRLSDLLNFHDEILTVTNGVILNRSGIATADGVPQLDVRLDELTLVIDRANDAPPPESAEAIEKKAYRLLVVTDGHVLTGTFFIYPGAEPTAYLRTNEPRWIPLADVRVRSLVDRRIKYGAKFAVLHRKAIVASSVL
jgi:hypothetical protein